MRVLMVVLMIGAACAGCAQKPTAPQSRVAPSGVTVSPGEALHGVLSVLGPGQSGVQGLTDPFFTADDGTAYAMDIQPGLDALTDPASSGRSLTLTGDVLRRDPVPVGEAPNEIVVTDFQFDP
jgi:hypothetical protein